MSKSLIEVILESCRKADGVHKSRTPLYVLSKCVEELGETAVEVGVHTGDSYKSPGTDGVIGEIIDTINALVDLAYVVDPTITEEKLIATTKPKLEKWLSRLQKFDQKKKGIKA